MLAVDRPPFQPPTTVPTLHSGIWGDGRRAVFTTSRSTLKRSHVVGLSMEDAAATGRPDLPSTAATAPTPRPPWLTSLVRSEPLTGVLPGRLERCANDRPGTADLSRGLDRLTQLGLGITDRPHEPRDAPEVRGAPGVHGRRVRLGEPGSMGVVAGRRRSVGLVVHAPT